jgi:hypothetical protein
MTASTINLGDDIQTLAAINFLKKKGITEYIFIDREKLSNYKSQPVTLIMNGWFIHDLSKFPPSDKITPIFISVHVNNEQLIKDNKLYFKKYEPIGCRDEHTVNLFKKNEIDAYFTGCLTLYFDEHNEKNNKKYLVDINTCKYIPKININLKKYIGFENIEHIESKKSILNNIEERLKVAENLLNKYRSAELVITTRLHCILPCRAFNTNAIFIHSKYKTDPRFKGLEKYINGDIIDHTNNNINRDIIKDIHIFFDNYDITKNIID